MKTFPRYIKYTVIGVCVLGIIAGGALGIHAIWTPDLGALFEGPVVVCEREEPVFYPRVNYKTEAYAAMERMESGVKSGVKSEDASKFETQADRGEIPYVDGEGRDEVEAAMHKSDGHHKESLALTRLRYDSAYKDRRPFKSLQILTPQDGALYPPNLCAPFVEWEDPRNDLWQVSIQIETDAKPQTFISSKPRWRIPGHVWKRLQHDAVGRDIALQIKGIKRHESGERDGEVQASQTVRFQFANDPADDFIVYRLVAPPFSSYKTPDIFCRDIREDQPKSFLSARRQYCLNCHNFSSKQGNCGKLALQVRSLVKVENNLPTYLAIYDIDKRKGFKVRLPFEIQMTTFMSWSRDGNKLAYSANQKVAAMKPIVFETQLAGMATSDIAVYDVEKNETYLMPGASDPNLLEIYPEWSPDGKQLIFARSPVGPHPAHILYDLCAVDLDAGENPEARPIEGASNNGRSNYYPHFSPDGKWFSFCQSDGGDLIRSSSDIYLKAGNLLGPSHRLEFDLDYAADSWHSWSSSSKWLVFASKRESGVYAYLYLSHIDYNGHASPAIPLPIIDRPMASFNIPEFIARIPDIDEQELFNAIRVEPKPRLVQEIKAGEENENVQAETSE